MEFYKFSSFRFASFDRKQIWEVRIKLPFILESNSIPVC